MAFFRVFFVVPSFFARSALTESTLFTEAFVFVVTLLEESFFVTEDFSAEDVVFFEEVLIAGLSLAVASTF